MRMAVLRGRLAQNEHGQLTDDHEYHRAPGLGWSPVGVDHPLKTLQNVCN
jgi:hypothetical protein